MAAAFPIILAILAVATLLVPSPSAPETPAELTVEQGLPATSASFEEPLTSGGVTGLEERSVDERAFPEGTEADQDPDDVSDREPLEVSDPEDEPVAPDAPPVYFMPVDGVKVADVPATFGDPRGSDRMHQGIDIVAARGTPVRSAAAGVVWRTSDSIRGGISVTVIGDDGVRYFYTHLDSIAVGVEGDLRVGTDTVLGYVGNTGNAAATAPHLHFEVSLPMEGERYRWRPIDPLLYMLDR